MNEQQKERESSLPPTYQCYQEGKRIFISYQKDGLRYSLPHYWYSREKAERAAWEHYHKEREYEKW